MTTSLIRRIYGIFFKTCTRFKKYKKITFLAKKAAREVIQTKATVKLDPMTSDERRVVHNVLAKFSHIETESVGEGKTRAVTIKYVD